MTKLKGAKNGELERGGYPANGMTFKDKREHVMWRNTWIARRGCGFARKKNSGINSWWMCKGCEQGGFKCVRGRVPVVVDNKVQPGKFVYTSFTYDEVRPCNCGANLGPPTVGDQYDKRSDITAACRRMFGSGNYTILEAGNRIGYNCNFCSGSVRGRLTKSLRSCDGGRYGGPVVVTEVEECKESCSRPVSSLIGDANDNCVVCFNELSLEPPSVMAVRLVGCCDSVLCLSCLE